MINIFYNGYRNPNGAITLTEHLIKMLEIQGESVSVHRIMKRSSKGTKSATKYGGFPMNDVTIEEAVELANRSPSLITHFMQKGAETAYALELISKAKCAFIIHDPRGLVPEVLAAAYRSRAKIVFIREAMRDSFETKYGQENYNIQFLPHPYVREHVNFISSYYRNAVTISRVGREKNTTMICEANRLLPVDNKIQIFGTDSDALYSYYTLDKKYPEWKENYLGESQSHGYSIFQLCKMSKFAIDMTTFKGDGGGTQYTFLKAMDAHCCLVVHRNWLSYVGEMVENVNCIAAETPEELARIVMKEPVQLPGYNEVLDAHNNVELQKNWQSVCYED